MSTAARTSARRARRALTTPFPVTVEPTNADVAIANAIARNTRPVLIDALETLRTKRDKNPPKKHGNIPL